MGDGEERETNGPVITVEAKVAGRRRPVVDGWHVPLPAPPVPAGGDCAGEALTLRALLASVVAHEVQAFRSRQEERRLAHVLSPDAIQRGATAGKIDAGGLREGEAGVEADETVAVAVALQGFEDGLYFVFLDGRQCERLDDAVYPHAGSTLQFIRLVALAGGEA